MLVNHDTKRETNERKREREEEIIEKLTKEIWIV